MAYLIDTHILIWAETDHSRLSPTVRGLLEDEVVFISVASIWEMANKTGRGKLRLSIALDLLLAETGFDILPIHSTHAIAAGNLPWHHQDPFDRMLIAQAPVERLTFLTSDATLACYGEFVRVV